MVLKHACIALAALWSAACVPEVDIVEADVYEVCYQGLPAQISAMSSDVAQGTLHIDAVEFGDATLDDPRVGLRELSIRPANGIDNFSFVDAAHVDVASESILHLPASSSSLYGESARPPNLLPHALDGDLDLTLVFEGDVPRASWHVVLDACFSVSGVSVTL